MANISLYPLGRIRGARRIVEVDPVAERHRSSIVQSVLIGVSFVVDGFAVLGAASLAGVPWPQMLVPAIVAALLLRKVGFRRGRLTLRVSDDVPAVVGRSSAALIVSAPVVPLPLDEWLLTTAVISWISILVLRAVVYSMVVAARRDGVAVNEVLIVGAGAVGTAVARVLEQRPEFGLQPIGFVDRSPADADHPVLGAPEALPHLIAELGVRHVILAFGQAREAETVSIIRRCAHLPVELYTLPRFFELGHTADPRTTEDLWGFPLVRLPRGGREQQVRRTKRTFDIVVAAGLGLLLSPVIAVCALAVRLSSPGPVLFRQERVGQFGRTMEMLKFRTMTVNDDADTTWTVEADARVTAVGRFLRPTHLDELPQLWNVLRGDMSIVGPRPERPFFVDQFVERIPGYHERHRYPVGLTGWAQVNGLWGDSSIEDRARLDNRYIDGWSLWGDVVILCRTLPTLLGRRES